MHLHELLARFPRRDGHVRLLLLHDPERAPGEVSCLEVVIERAELTDVVVESPALG